MADFINLQAEDVDDGNSSSDNQDDNDAVTSFIDDTNSEENLSDYYCFVNVSRPVGRVEEDAFFWLIEYFIQFNLKQLKSSINVKMIN